MIQKKKLLIAAESFAPRKDGVAVFLKETINRLKDTFDITVLAPAYEGYKDDDPKVKIIRLSVSKKQWGDYKPAKWRFKKIKNAVKNTDLIWVNGLFTIGLPTIYFGSKYNKKIFSWLHHIEWELVPDSLKVKGVKKKFLGHAVKTVVRKAYDKCTTLMAPSRETATKLKHVGVTVPKAIIKAGVDTEHYKPAKNKELIRKKLRLPAKTFIIGYCGRVGAEKNLRTLVKAFQIFNSENPDARLLIVGDGPDKIKEPLKQKNVKITGFVEDPAPYYQAMDAYVLPSLTETTSLTTLEAMSTGLPVIVTPSGLIKEYVKNRINGLLFPKRSWEVLLSHLNRVYKNKDFAETLGRNARQSMIEEFSWDSTAMKIEHILKSK
ncbi:glycosyltransferase family 4 protein [Candidatus Woesearchaeota archaeon]|nr:glycosyltransferase family 4 protein [Candidatus Woesearchaeota archaeon]